MYPIAVDRMTHMIGSQAPKMEVQSSTTPEENAPSGLLARGSYTVTSLFTDDYNTEHLKVSLLKVKHIIDFMRSII